MEEQRRPKITDPNLALEKMRNWCAYQERCQQEARNKLYEYGLWPEAVESIISSLINENFLNEERFAKAYAGGKFRIKKWGRIKIKAALRQKKLTEYCINKGLKEIDERDYVKTLEKLLADRSKKVKEKNPIRRNYKLLQYAYGRGFEQDLVMEILKQEE
ncbi:MAG: regulatory protein RecX [Bacteroidia bacterium]